MEKKNLKWYDAPQVEVVEMEMSVSMLAGSSGSSSTGQEGMGGDNGDSDTL